MFNTSHPLPCKMIKDSLHYNYALTLLKAQEEEEEVKEMSSTKVSDRI